MERSELHSEHNKNTVFAEKVIDKNGTFSWRHETAANVVMVQCYGIRSYGTLIACLHLAEKHIYNWLVHTHSHIKKTTPPLR